MTQQRENTESGLKTSLGLLLLSLLAALFFYQNPSTISENEVILLKGKLKFKPTYEENGENPNYIALYLEGQDKMFQLSSCALYSIDNQRVLGMAAGDVVTLLVDKAKFYKKKSVLNKSVKVYGIEANSKKILTLKMINSCEKRAWKRILWFAPFFCVAVIISLIGLLGRRRKKKFFFN